MVTKKTGKSICIMFSDLGGGTARHAGEMALEWSGFVPVVLVKVCGRVLDIAILEHRRTAVSKCLFQAGEPTVLANVLSKLGVGIIHIHSFNFMYNELLDFVPKSGIPYVVTLHDYYVVCPRSNLFSKGKFCGIPVANHCNECLSFSDFEYENIYQGNCKDIFLWREYWEKFLTEAVNIFCPSDDHRLRLLSVFPCLSHHIRTMENPEIINYCQPNKRLIASKHEGRALRVGILGLMEAHKGRDALLECAELAYGRGLSIEFVLFGDIIGGPSRAPSNVNVLGRYEENKIYEIIADQKIDFFWFPAVVPETYSYALTIPIRLHIPVISADIGAIADRIKSNGWGIVYPLDSSAEGVLNALLGFDFVDIAQKGDFVVKNDKFPIMEAYYGDMSFSSDEFLNLEAILSDMGFDDARMYMASDAKSLKWQEFKSLCRLSEGVVEKVKFAVALDKSSVWPRVLRRIKRILNLG